MASWCMTWLVGVLMTKRSHDRMNQRGLYSNPAWPITLNHICHVMKTTKASGWIGRIVTASGKMAACTTASHGLKANAAHGVGLRERWWSRCVSRNSFGWCISRWVQ